MEAQYTKTQPMPVPRVASAPPSFERWCVDVRTPDYGSGGNKTPVRSVALPDLLPRRMPGRWMHAIRTGVSAPAGLMVAALGALGVFWVLVGV